MGTSGQAKYLMVQGADDQIAPPVNGVDLKNELDEQVTLITCPGQPTLLPLEQPETTASHMISFIRQLVRKPRSDLRLYSPLEPFFTKAWRPSESELVR